MLARTMRKSICASGAKESQKISPATERTASKRLRGLIRICARRDHLEAPCYWRGAGGGTRTHLDNFQESSGNEGFFGKSALPLECAVSLRRNKPQRNTYFNSGKFRKIFRLAASHTRRRVCPND